MECPYNENDESIKVKPNIPGIGLWFWKRDIHNNTNKKPKNSTKTDWPAFDDKAIFIIKGSNALCKSPPIFPAAINNSSGVMIDPMSDDLPIKLWQYASVGCERKDLKWKMNSPVPTARKDRT